MVQRPDGLPRSLQHWDGVSKEPRGASHPQPLQPSSGASASFLPCSHRGWFPDRRAEHLSGFQEKDRQSARTALVKNDPACAPLDPQAKDRA